MARFLDLPLIFFYIIKMVDISYFRLKVKNEIQYIILKKKKKEIKTTIHLSQQYTDREWGTNNNEHYVNNVSFGKNK